MKQFTLGKNERLKSRKAIDRIFKEGKSFPLYPFRVYYFKRPPAKEVNDLLFGVTVSSRNFKNAVDRNTIKRRTREAYRLQKKILADALTQQKTALDVFFLYTNKEIADSKTVHDKMNLCLQKLITIVNENIAAHT